ncbi:MAG: AN1-type zinc finger domain-containing protein [Candidatus Hodarchaeales archaeon]|jgi:hypothetical protein
MQELDSWIKKLSKQEKIVFSLIILYVIVSSVIFITIRDNFFLFNLLVGINILLLSIYFSFLIIPRKTKVIHLYGDSRRNSDYYSDEQYVPEINLRKYDQEDTKSKQSKKSSISKACFFCQKREMLPYVCKYCMNSYCTDHRLPEKHNCKDLN